MSEVTWGQIAKSTIDKQTITEAINSALLTHNQDASAHSQATEPIYNHRTATDLDHPDGSISLSKLRETKFVLSTIFESLDGWAEKTAGVSSTIGEMYIQTGSTINTVRYAMAYSLHWLTITSPVRNPFWQTLVWISSNTNCTVYIVAGSILLDGTDNNYGFKVVNGTLYALVTESNGVTQTEYTTAIAGIDVTQNHVYKCVVDDALENIYFYVDGVLKHTEETHYPITTSFEYMFAYYIKNTAAESKYMAASYLMIESDK